MTWVLTSIVDRIHATERSGPLCVSPNEYRELHSDLGLKPYPPYTPISIYGCPILLNPFYHDPRFRTFQSMASLAGTFIHYKTLGQTYEVVSAWYKTADGDTINYRPELGVYIFKNGVEVLL